MAAHVPRIVDARPRRSRAFMAQPFQHPHSGIYQLRRKVPEDLRPALGREYKRSLKTREPSEAKARFAAEWSRSERAFAMARAQLAGVEVLTQFDMHQLADRWYQQRADELNGGADPAQWLADGPGGSYETAAGHQESVLPISLREALKEEEDDRAVEPLLDGFVRAQLRREGLPMPMQAAAQARLRNAFKQRWLDLSDLALKRFDGDWSTSMREVPAAPPVARRGQSSTGAMSVAALFAIYKQDKLLNDGDSRAVRRTVDAYEAIVSQFAELCGDPPISQISRETIRSYRTLLAQLPSKGVRRGMSPSQMIQEAQLKGLPLLTEPTIRNKLKAVSAILSVGVQYEHIDENPVLASGVAKAATKAATRLRTASRKRRDYSQEDLKQIFASPIYSQEGWSPPRADFGGAWYWMPLLMYYTGARREELAQLAVRDVVFPKAEEPYISILALDDDEDGLRSVKTSSSRRLIPLHSDLLSLGFINYANALGDQDGPLFPGLTADPAGYYGTNFGKRWAEYLRLIVRLESAASPSHGFRHTFKTLCREAGIAEDVIDAVTGHANGSVARSYGEMPLSRMARELKKFPSAPLLIPVLQDEAKKR